MNIFETPSASKGSSQEATIKKASNINQGQVIFEKYLANDQRLLEENFSDLWKQDPEFYAAYSPENIARDKRRVEMMKKSKSYEAPDSYAVVLENMFGDVAEGGKVFGDGRYAITQLSEFDDKIVDGAHCDLLLELEIDGGILNLGIDITTASNFDTLNKKRDKCFEGVKSGKLASIKYYQSKLTESKGKIGMVPVVVVGLDREAVADLCHAIGVGDDITKHYAQFIILDEINHELGRLVAAAQVQHGNESDLAMALDYYQSVFVDIAEKKKNLRTTDSNAKVKADKAYKFLTAYF